MSAFIVILPEDSGIEAEEIKTFQHHYELVAERAWLVSDDRCFDASDVRDEMKIGEGKSGAGGWNFGVHRLRRSRFGETIEEVGRRMNEPVPIDPERRKREQPYGGGGNGSDDRLRQVELDIRELKAERRHMATKEDLLDTENRLSQAISDVRTTLAKLVERVDCIKEHYASKWFILSAMATVAALVVAALKLLP